MKKWLLAFSALWIVLATSAQQKPEGLFINSKAPDFKLKDQAGNEVSLKELRKKGSTVLIFYRGSWCPYCNKQLKALQDSLDFITRKGASLVAITPEAPEGTAAMATKTGATFPLLYDADLKTSTAYGVSFNVDEKTVNRYKMSGIDLLKANQQKAAMLPVPAVYIINKEGSIVYRYFDDNYKKRVSVNEILQQLK